MALMVAAHGMDTSDYGPYVSGWRQPEKSRSVVRPPANESKNRS